MQKILINRCFGGFGLSAKCLFEVAKRKNGGKDPHVFTCTTNNQMVPCTQLDAENGKLCDSFYYTSDIPEGTECDYTAYEPYILASDLLFSYGNDKHIRADADLIAVVKRLGAKACGGRFAELKIVSVPDDVKWEITEYDGMEAVEEVHRIWR